MLGFVGILVFALAVKQAVSVSEPLCCAVGSTFLEDILIATARHHCPSYGLDLPDKYDSSYECQPQQCRIEPRTYPHKMLECINAVPQPVEPPQINIPEDSPVRLRAAATWRSNKQPNINVTVTTTLSLDRLPQLLAQCRSWMGPLSAAVYMVVSPQENPEAAMRQLTCTIRHLSRLMRYVDDDPQVCSLDMILVYEHKPPELALGAFPINTLRNIARVMARTQLVALMDVDFLISREFSSSLCSSLSYSWISNITENNGAVVMAAFDVAVNISGTGNNVTALALLADQLVAANKSVVVRSFQRQELLPFEGPGHLPSNYSNWIATDQAYAVTYADRYEPYLLVDRLRAPWYDSRYRGYHLNKIEHAMHMNWTGYRFVVHPTAYTVHRAHPHSAARIRYGHDAEMIWNGTHSSVSSLSFADALYAAALTSMAQGTFVPVLDNYTTACLQELPWWPRAAH